MALDYKRVIFIEQNNKKIINFDLKILILVTLVLFLT